MTRMQMVQPRGLGGAWTAINGDGAAWPPMRDGVGPVPRNCGHRRPALLGCIDRASAIYLPVVLSS